jgi:hypothetical protein
MLDWINDLYMASLNFLYKMREFYGQFSQTNKIQQWRSKCCGV